MKQSELSIIIPAYNEELNIKSTVQSIFNFPERTNWEVIVVNDGSKDSTSKILRELNSKYSDLKLIDFDSNHGKGWAVKQGMLKSTGEWTLFMDADSSTQIEQIKKLWPFKQQYDVIIGSRHLQSGSIKKPQPKLRHLAGRIGNIITQKLLLSGICDTQCGFKLFNQKATQDLFTRQQNHGWSFDLEILALAQALDYKIKEVPVDWSHHSSDRINIVSDGINIFVDVVKIKHRINHSLSNKTDYARK